MRFDPHYESLKDALETEQFGFHTAATESGACLFVLAIHLTSLVYMLDPSHGPGLPTPLRVFCITALGVSVYIGVRVLARPFRSLLVIRARIRNLKQHMLLYRLSGRALTPTTDSEITIPYATTLLLLIANSLSTLLRTLRARLSPGRPPGDPS